MLIVNEHEGQQINKGVKTDSLRPIRESGKGYLTEGSLQYIYVGRDFRKDPLARVLILNRSFVNVGDLTQGDFLALGYPSKAEYMEQPYNQRNPSPERIKYHFINLQELLDLVDLSEWDEDLFFELWGFCSRNKELRAGVEADNIYYGCDLEDLEEALITLQSNLREALTW